MFRRVYSQVLGMLVLSTVLLIGVLGVAVDAELRAQLTTQEKAALSDELCDIKQVIPSLVPGAACKATATPLDQRGQDVFFVVTDNTGNAVEKTSNHPVPFTYLRSHFRASGFQTFTYQDHPYRLLAKTLQGNRTTYTAYVYELTTGELDTIHRVTQIMVAIGGIGLLLSLGINIFVTRRALQPAQRTWNAYQDSMVELSHELQTPLATASVILENRNLDAKTKADLQAELDRASNMVKNILYLSRLRTQQPETEQGPVAVSDVTEEVADRFAILAKNRNINLSGHAEPGLFAKTTIEAWEHLVSTLLKNVVDHATDNSSATWKLSKSAEMICLVVENTRLETQRSDNLSAGDSGDFAHGYGLQIVHRLIADMRGTVSIEINGPVVKVTVSVPLLTR